MFLLNAPNIKDHGAQVYLNGRRAPRMTYFNPIDRTILQMKNSGGFRLIRNNKASTSILNYYAAFNFIEQIQNVNAQQADTYRNITLEIFDPMIFESMLSDTTSEIKMPRNNPALISYDKKLLARLTGAIHYFNSSRKTLTMNFYKQKQNADNLILLLKNEYHLK